MVYNNPNENTKHSLAIQIAAALTHLLIHQGDKVSLTMFDKNITYHTPPAGTKGHISNLMRELSKTKPNNTTNIRRTINECVPLFKKRGKVVIISDFMDMHENIFDSLSKFLHKNHEVLLIQVLANDELNLPKSGMANFIDLETAESIQVNVEEIRENYQNELKEFTQGLAKEATNRRIDYHLINPANPYYDALESFITFHTKSKKRKK